MSILTTSRNLGLDMGGFGLFAEVSQARVRIVSDERYVLITPSGKFVIDGSGFAAPDRAGVPLIGQIRSITYQSASGGASLTGLSLPAAQFRNLIGDPAALQALLFAGSDTITGSIGMDILYGLDGDDQLSGGEGDDRLFGGAGSDWLDGGAGRDAMLGGVGNDVYLVRSLDDMVDEGVSEGTDLVHSWVSLTLSNDVENLTLRGHDDLNGTGNALDNVIVGNTGQTILRGEGGDDILISGTQVGTHELSNQAFGGEGNDTIRAGGTSIIGSGEAGDDRITGSGGWDYLYGGSGDDYIAAAAGNDYIAGGDGDDRLVGGAGADRMLGGTGADRFVFQTGDLNAPNPRLEIDWVMDFNPREGDRIDLSRIDADILTAGDQAFFRIDAGFTGRAGEYIARVITDRNGDAFLNAVFDVNGDGLGDFALRVTGDMGGSSGWVL